jgi:hypothetical protein
MRLIATYGTKMFQVGGYYESDSGNSDVYVEDKTSYGVSGHVNLAGGHKIKLQYMTGSADLSDDDGTGTKVTYGDGEQTQISLGYDFKMGKATTVYAMYTQANQKENVKSQYQQDYEYSSREEKYSFIGVGLIQNF